MTVTFADGSTITVEAGLSAATGTYGIWDTSLFDTGTFGPEITWVDVSAYFLSIKTDRRFSRGIQAWDAGTMNITFKNRDGRFSPDNLSGPYVSGGITQIRPWRPIRVKATYGTSSKYLFTGYALDWKEGWAPAGPNKGDAICTVPCVDELGRLARFDGYEQPTIGAGELSGLRVHRVLNNAGHTGERSIESGVVTLQGTTLASNTVTELKLVTDSEGGGLFIDGDGTVVYEGQFSLLNNTRSNTVQATFGDAGGSEISYLNAVPTYAGDLIRNITRWSRVGGSIQTGAGTADNTSRALYGDLQDSRTDLLCETDAQVLALSTFFIEQRKDPEKRFESLTFAPRAHPSTQMAQAIERRPRDLIRVKRQPPGGHTLDRYCHISGIHHSIEVGNKWEVTFDLWSASVYQTYFGSLWDSALFDTNNWFF
jgi:hypothetical protein